MILYIAQFEHGRPQLAKAKLIKETEKSFIIDGNWKNILNTYYLPNRLDKELYSCSTDTTEILQWLFVKINNHLIKLQQDIIQTEEWKEKLAQLIKEV